MSHRGADVPKTVILVLGGAGYIGSHTCKAIALRGWVPVVVDNLSSGRPESVRWGPFHDFDVRDTTRLRTLIHATTPQAVLHFAGSCYVAESMQRPLDYYENNARATLSVVQACVSAGV